MADVDPGRPGDRERGQLILVTGLLVAVTMVALVLLLNTAIYTENLASRGTDQSGREAIEYRATVVQSVDGLIEAEHNRGHENSHTLWTNVSDGIVRIDNLTARSYATDGTIVQIDKDALTIHNGSVINQSTDQAFESANADPEWVLVEDVRGVRSFTMTVAPDVSTNESSAIEDGAFNVTIDNGTAWKQYIIYLNESAGGVEIAARTNGGDTEVIDTSSSNLVEIDFVNHTVDGNEVSELDWTDEVAAPYQIKFGNGSAASGTYDLTVNSSTVDTNDFGVDPSYDPIVYRVDLPLYFETPSVTYRTTVRIVPGEDE